MNIPLSIFPAPLLRLILCGGKGLPPAWGPVLQAGSQVLGCGDPNYGQWAWDAVLGAAVRPDRAPKYLLDKPDGWSIPLDDASPWPARLAMVAAWMLDPFTARSLGAIVEMGRRHYNDTEAIVEMRLFRWDEPYLLRWLQNGACQFTRDQGRAWIGNMDLNLPTLPQHLQTHPPAVALLLALYDVPEIRARVESA